MKLDERIRELIAIGASVTANCQPCLQYHTDKAVEIGADADEISGAIEVGRTVRKGAAFKMDRFTSELKTAAPSEVKESREGCGCG